MTFANNLDPDEAPQNVGLHLRSKLFENQIIYRHKKLVGNKDLLQILKKKIFKKNYPACKKLNRAPVKIPILHSINPILLYEILCLTSKFLVETILKRGQA